MNTEAIAGTGLPIEIRRSTAQLVRLEVGQWVWFVPVLLLIWLPIVLAGEDGPNPWLVAVWVGCMALAVLLDVRRRRKEVLRLTEHGLYAGRDDGKKLAWLGPHPVQLAWDEIRQIRLTDTRFSRKVMIDTTTFPRLLAFPMSTWFNPDPELDARVELVRRTWEANRGPLPPPPGPPLFLPPEPPPPTR